MALQSCTVQLGMPPGVLCGAVQELHQCLVSLTEEDCLLKLEMLDVAEKDPMAPTPASTPSFPTPDSEEEQVILTPKESCTSEPEEATCLEGGLTLIQGWYPTRPPGFSCLPVTQTHASLGRGIPLGAQLDLHSLGSLQVTISHGPASLQLVLFKPSEPSESSPRIQELWADAMLSLLLMSNSTAPWPLMKDDLLYSSPWMEWNIDSISSLEEGNSWKCHRTVQNMSLTP